MSGEHIVSTPGVVGGVPRIAGTRIQAALIASLIRDGFDADGIAALYPSVTSEHVEAVRGWMHGPGANEHPGNG